MLHGKTLRQLLNYLPTHRPDLMIVLIDADGEAARKRELEAIVSAIPGPKGAPTFIAYLPSEPLTSQTYTCVGAMSSFPPGQASIAITPPTAFCQSGTVVATVSGGKATVLVTNLTLTDASTGTSFVVSAPHLPLSAALDDPPRSFRNRQAARTRRRRAWPSRSPPQRSCAASSRFCLQPLHLTSPRLGFASL